MKKKEKLKELKAVILAAGKSTRTFPLTLTRPKSLLPVANKTVLQHTLEQLNGLVDEAVIVVGYKGDMIKKEFGRRFGGIKLTYVGQQEQKGTGHAVLQAKQFIRGRFLVLYGDDLFFKDDIKKLLNHQYAALVKQHSHPEGRFGVFVTKKGVPVEFVEKPETFVSNLVNIGCYILDDAIFTYHFTPSLRGELELTDFINHLIHQRKLYCVQAQHWFPITYPWDLLAANAFLLSKIKKTEKKGAVIEKNVTIKGRVVIGKKTIINSGTYIEGPVMIGERCTIGPNAYLRPSTTIGSHCKVGHEVEIKNCILFDKAAVPHLSYLGDSVIGEGVNVAAGSITANFRHDAGLIRSSVRKQYRSQVVDELIGTGLSKFGTIIGDHAKLGIRTLIYPGRKIWPGKTTLPGDMVKHDIDDDTNDDDHIHDDAHDNARVGGSS